MVSDFLGLTQQALQEPAARQRLAEALMPLFRRRDMPAIYDGKLCEWIQRASALGVDLLLDAYTE
jgi:hypothetical protein